jgi:hypothetical protein
MKEGKLKGYLEVATNIAVLLVALLILGKVAWTYLGEKPSPSPHLQAGIRKGGPFSLIPRVDYAKRPQTLVIAMSSTCERCNESVPFFKQILQANAENGDKTQIVAVFPENAEEVGRYISEQRISLDAVPGVDYRALNLPGTPTAVLVSSEGTLINFWIGKSSNAAEKEILESINR